MNCPLCGALMVWLNGSVLHNPPTKYYQCKNDTVYVMEFEDGTYEIEYPQKNLIYIVNNEAAMSSPNNCPKKEELSIDDCPGKGTPTNCKGYDKDSGICWYNAPKKGGP